jgi:hypothetical protein
MLRVKHSFLSHFPYDEDAHGVTQMTRALSYKSSEAVGYLFCPLWLVISLLGDGFWDTSIRVNGAGLVGPA